MNALRRRGRAARPTMKSPDDTMTLTEHLGELRVRIIRSALAVMVAAIAIIAFYDQVLEFLTRPYLDLCSGREVEFCGFDPASWRERPQHLRPARGRQHTPARRQLRRTDRRHARGPVADLAVHRAGVARQGEALRDPVHPVVDRPVRAGWLPRLRDVGAGARLPHLLQWRGRRTRVPGQPLHPPRRTDGRRVRCRLPVPGAPRLPADRRRHLARPTAAQLALRPADHRRPGRRHHPVGRPDLARRPRRADDGPLLPVDRVGALLERRKRRRVVAPT